MVQSRAGADGTVQIALRLPTDLRDRIKEAAAQNGRSMNSEIVSTLEDAYPDVSFDYIALNTFVRQYRDARSDDDQEGMIDLLQRFLRSPGNTFDVYEDDDGEILVRRR